MEPKLWKKEKTQHTENFFMSKPILILRKKFGFQVPNASCGQKLWPWDLFLGHQRIPKSLWHRNKLEADDLDPFLESYPILTDRFTFVRYAKKGRFIGDNHSDHVREPKNFVTDKFFFSSNIQCRPNHPRCSNVSYLYGSDIDNLQGPGFDIFFKEPYYMAHIWSYSNVLASWNRNFRGQNRIPNPGSKSYKVVNDMLKWENVTKFRNGSNLFSPKNTFEADLIASKYDIEGPIWTDYVRVDSLTFYRDVLLALSTWEYHVNTMIICDITRKVHREMNILPNKNQNFRGVTMKHFATMLEWQNLVNSKTEFSYGFI